ncbi:hypothetical protein ACS0TY_007068 [Phlomoides rotata]
MTCCFPPMPLDGFSGSMSPGFSFLYLIGIMWMLIVALQLLSWICIRAWGDALAQQYGGSAAHNTKLVD